MNRLGKEGEDAAVAFLSGKGYAIIEKNYRTPFGEIDIIAKDLNTIVFVEVKTRSDAAFGQPFEAVNQKKRAKMSRVALSFLKRFKHGVPARFDVLSITVASGGHQIEHIADAFEL